MTPHLWPLPHIPLPRWRQRDTLIVQPLAAPPALKQLGIQIVGNDYADGAWFGANGYADILRANPPAYVNLVGAGQYSAARQRAQWILDTLPGTRVLFRHMIHATPTSAGDKTDGGMWRLPALEYRDNIIRAHDYHTSGLYVVTDNEASFSRVAGETWYEYSHAQSEVIKACVPIGARLAVLRTPTHWPMPQQIADGELDELLETVGAFMDDEADPRVILSPNAYFDDFNVDGLARLHLMADRFWYVNGFAPVMCLGEYGYDRDFTSGNGWLTTGMGADVYTNMLAIRALEHLEPDWGACVYCAGIGDDAKVAHFLLNRAELRILLAKSAVWQVAPSTDIPLEPTPEENPMRLYTPALVRTINGADKGVNVRRAKDATSEYLLTLLTGMEIEYAVSEPGVAYKSLGDRWIPVRTPDGVEGFVFSYYLAFDPRPPVVPEPEPDPDDTTPLPTPVYLTSEQLDERLADFYEDIVNLIAEVALKQGAGYADVNRFLADKLESLKEAA